jgi:hypothetical protein
MNQVSVRINEARQDDAAIQFEQFGGAGLLQLLDLGDGAYGSNPAANQQNGSIAKNADVGKGLAAARRAAADRHDL